MSQRIFSLGDLAEHLGVQMWRLQRLYELEVPGMPTPQIVGRIRVLTEEDIPAVQAALAKRGWLKQREAAANA